MNTDTENTTDHNLKISDETYEQLDHYRLRTCVDVGGHLDKWTEPWDDFFERYLTLNVFIDPKDIRDPDEIDISEVEMPED